MRLRTFSQDSVYLIAEVAWALVRGSNGCEEEGQLSKEVCR